MRGAASPRAGAEAMCAAGSACEGIVYRSVVTAGMGTRSELQAGNREGQGSFCLKTRPFSPPAGPRGQRLLPARVTCVFRSCPRAALWGPRGRLGCNDIGCGLGGGRGDELSEVLGKPLSHIRNRGQFI